MTKKIVIPFLCVFLLFDLAGTPASAETPLITGIPIDEELAELLSQVNRPNRHGNFFSPLNRLINEDLAEQSDEYKLAAAKLALRVALAINRVVDSIEVRRYCALEGRTGAGKYRGRLHGNNVSGDFYWTLGAYSENPGKLGYWDETCHGVTLRLFTLREGKIARINLLIDMGACGGKFSCCCLVTGCPPGIDDAWLQHFIDLGRADDFPIGESEFTPKVMGLMLERSQRPIERLDLRGYSLVSRIPTENIANLAMFTELKHLDAGYIHHGRTDTEERRAAFLALFSKLPTLETIVIDGQEIKRPE